MADKRDAVRKRSFIPATIAAGNVEVACTILDLSETGAKLRLPAGYFLSSSCYIRTPQLGTSVPSRIVWRSQGEAGIVFK